MKLVKHGCYTAQLVDYAADGSAIAKIEGRVVMVPGGAVEDVCGLRIVKLGSSVDFGEIQTLCVPSPHRISPLCPHASRCGGCCFQHISYQEELRAKEKRVLDALTRIGRLHEIPWEGIQGSPSQTHYRNKAQYPVGENTQGRTITGCYQARSHTIVPIRHCLLQSPVANHLAHLVCQWMDAHHLPPYDPVSGRGWMRHIYVRTGVQSGEHQLTLVVTQIIDAPWDDLIQRLQGEVPSLTSLLLNINTSRSPVVLGDTTRTLWGKDHWEEVLLGLHFQLSPHAFFQVNPVQTQHLYTCALEFASLSSEDIALDLYCGVGSMTLIMAQRAKKVIGVEWIPQAVENAEANCRRNGLSNVEFLCADAGQAVVTLQNRGVIPHVICLDPPRKGLDPKALDAVGKLHCPRLVYISCDPATLARDLKDLCQRGYHLKRVKSFDLFPRTPHVETVVLLSQEQNRPCDPDRS